MCSIAEWQVASQTCCILSYSWCHHNWMAGVMQSHSHHGNEYCLLHAACCHFTLHACMIIIMQLPQEQYKPHRVCWHPLCSTFSCLFSMSSSENNEKWAASFLLCQFYLNVIIFYKSYTVGYMRYDVHSMEMVCKPVRSLRQRGVIFHNRGGSKMGLAYVSTKCMYKKLWTPCVRAWLMGGTIHSM
jgi:hypothetical protein